MHDGCLTRNSPTQVMEKLQMVEAEVSDTLKPAAGGAPPTQVTTC